MAKKNLSRSDLAQHILHQYYELHTILIFLKQKRNQQISFEQAPVLQNCFYLTDPLLRISLLNNEWRFAVWTFFN